MAFTSPVSLMALALLPLGLFAVASPPAAAQQVDRSTPHAQNGLTLLAIVRGDANGQYRFPVPAGLSFLSGPTSNGPAGGIGLWIKGTAPPHVPNNGRFGQPYGMQMPTVSAEGPGYEALPAQAQPQYSPGANGQMASAPLYFVSLPGGYPDGYGPIDVTLSDPQGHHARWRLVNLPPSYHAIPGAVATHAVFTHGPVTLNVRAWRDNGPPGFNNNTADFRGIGYRIDAAIPARSHWAIRITQAQLEWEALRPNALPVMHYPPNYPRPAVFIADFGQAMPRPPGFPPALQNTAQNTVRTPYGAHDRYLRLSGQLIQLATAQETLTFHNLNVRQRPNPYANTPVQRGPNGKFFPRYTPPPSYEISGPTQTVVTPSGISVTLLSPSTLPQNQGFGGFGGNSIQMVFKFNGAAPGMMPGAMPVSLPRSPLVREYHKPVTFTLQASLPYSLQNFFPLGGYSPQRSNGGQEFMATLMMPYSTHPTFVTRPNTPKGVRFPVYTPPTVPKHFQTLTFTVAQRAELKAIPISFLVPISAQAPPSLYPQFIRRTPVSVRPR